MEYKLESVPCCYSTTEGEPELYHSEGSSSHSTPLHQEQPTILHCHTGATMRDLTEETTPEWYGPALNQPQGKHPASFTPAP